MSFQNQKVVLSTGGERCTYIAGQPRPEYTGSRPSLEVVVAAVVSGFLIIALIVFFRVPLAVIGSVIEKYQAELRSGAGQ
jgi:hypothetical protein